MATGNRAVRVFSSLPGACQLAVYNPSLGADVFSLFAGNGSASFIEDGQMLPQEFTWAQYTSMTRPGCYYEV